MYYLRRFLFLTIFEKCLFLIVFCHIFVPYLYRALNTEYVRLIRSYFVLIAFKYA